MDDREPSLAAAVAAIDDAPLRARWEEAAAGGASLSEREIFEALLAVQAAEARALLLAHACGDDAATRRRIEALLEHEAEPDGHTWTSSFGPVADVWRSPLPTTVDHPAPGKAPAARPERIGRYLVQRILGSGTFGVVWLGYDEELRRPVAVKVRRPERMVQDPEAFLAEARTAAAVVHPNIVQVYDIGRQEDGSIYVVSRFVDGPTLGVWMGEERPSPETTAVLVAKVARALDHAHEQGIVHRDVNPNNILVDELSGEPYVADFGIAISRAVSLAETRVVGTPAYMSPEQARGEGHRIDRRSDVFSVGVVLYEMLTRRRAFEADSITECLHRVANVDPPPPRDHDPAIPEALEAICLKAIAKRRRDRHESAAALAEDLEGWIKGHAAPRVADREEPAVEVQAEPKGLRSFDASDADVFLPLVPGLRDRDGLPESIRFWKQRIESTDPATAFAVGLLCGPSGCGKSSLMKAGVLPRLRGGVRPIVLAASSDDTEARLLEALRRETGELPAGAGLAEAFARCRETRGRKVVVVIDQFEQWLQAFPDPAGSDLVAALRQCDGVRLQAVILVRDDFAMSAARFMEAVDCPIDQGVRNFATVNLFPADHARQVLVRFGQALGRLPPRPEGPGAAQAAFVDAVIEGLGGEGGLVVPVQLALFVDLVKQRPWTPATLAAIGDSLGPKHRLLDRVGVAFLHESFDARSANPSHRLHAPAAKRVLESLLPPAASGIRGHTQSRSALLAASGYAARPGAFAALLRILDGDLRVVTPSESPEPSAETGGRTAETQYQLTHDFLVPALRDWLTAQRRRTVRGRAELLLADRTAGWGDRPEQRQLPTLAEWVNIRWHSRPAAWTSPQRRMMAAADRRQGTRLLSAAAVAGMVLLIGMLVTRRAAEKRLDDRARGAARTLLAAAPGRLDAALADATNPEIAGRSTRLLRESFGGEDDPAGRLNAALALARLEAADEPVWRHLVDRLLSADAAQIETIRTALVPRQADLGDELWGVVADPQAGPRRLRAAAGLAAFAPSDPRWEEHARGVADDLVRVPAVDLATWIAALQPAAVSLVPPLLAVAVDPGRPETERTLAIGALSDYAADAPETLAELLVSADQKLVPPIVSARDFDAEGVAAALEAGLTGALPPSAAAAPLAPGAEPLRRAKGAAALLRLGRPSQAWPVFALGDDPSPRSHLIHLLGPFGIDANLVAERLAVEPDTSARRALVLALGTMATPLVPTEGSVGGIAPEVVRRVRDAFLEDADAGIHAAAEWTLGMWGEGAWIAAQKERWAEASRAGGPAVDRAASGRTAGWLVNSQGQTFTVIRGPVEFRMGGPPEEGALPPHLRRIDRSFAIASTPVTIGQFDAILGRDARASIAERIDPRYARSLDIPMIDVSWHDAAEYCNALSRAEEIPEDQWVYERDPAETRWIPKTDHLLLGGYRLPTEAEWEYAARAGTATARSQGDADSLLAHYAWYRANAEFDGVEVPWPVGTRKPNDLGLFDTLGNVWNLCQDQLDSPLAVSDDGTPVDDEWWGRRVPDDALVMKRGGSFAMGARFVRSAYRGRTRPGSREVDTGFRVVRTLPSSPPRP